MGTFIKIFSESISQALQQLFGNKLRSFLSLLGITIGIFCVVGVFAGVESLQSYIRKNLERLGNDMVYVQKWPFVDTNLKWWDIMKHPQPTYEDYEAVRDKVKNKDLSAYYVVIGAKTLKFQSNSAERTILIGISPEASEIFNLEYENGRYFSPSEFRFGSNKVLIGYDVAEALFGAVDPVGKKLKMMGRKFEVIGVLKKVGDDDFTPMDYDEAVFVTYNNAKGLANLKSKYIFESAVAVKASQGVNVENLKDEIRGVVRAERRLKPKQRDNFALNELAMIMTIMDSFFMQLNLLGIVIGGFAMLVGGVSVANIMFVSVKERTNIIGVKKAMGAKRYMILLEFLIESVILCIMGGLFGLGLISILAWIMTNALNFELFLSFKNITIGLFFSIIIGIISGAIPALQAARMDPVNAMRK